MKRYDSYKDSGVQWIGKIPSHWDSSSLLFVLRNKISDGPHETPVFVDDGIPFISIDSLNDSKDIDFSVVKKFISTEDYERYCQKTKLEEGDILFTKAATIGKTAIVRDDIFMVWSPLAILKPDYKKLTSLFLYYLVNCKELVQEAILSGSMSTQINVGMRELEKVKIPIPTLSEQNFISDYLDVKCGEIDKLIAIQQRRIELLQELRQSIITRAVTRGINPDVPLRDSGIDWIGQIPTHWEIRRIKSICKSEKYSIKTGPFGSQLKGQDLMLDGDVRVYNQRNVIDNDFDDIHFFVTKEKATELDSFYTQPQDLLITSRGTIGKCSILPADVPMGLLHPCLIALRINQAICDLDWAHIFISSSSCFSTNIFLNSNATTIEVIYTDTLKNVSMPLPPLSEQREIVTHIKHETAKVDHALQQAERQIELLQELRQSVITEVVTGKRKVC